MEATVPKMKNVSQRKFVIAGKELKQGEEGDFAQSVIDRHIAMYPTELQAAVKEEAPKEEPKPFVPTPKVEELKSEAKEPEKKYPSQMNKAELQAYLTDKGITFPEDASKKELVELAK